MSVSSPRLPGGWGEICSLRAAQVSVCLFLSETYSTDLNEGNRAHFGLVLSPFCPPLQGGQHYKNRDCAQTQRAFVLPFWAIVLVCIGDSTMPTPPNYIQVCHRGGCGCTGVKISNSDTKWYAHVSPLCLLILITYTSSLPCFYLHMLWSALSTLESRFLSRCLSR